MELADDRASRSNRRSNAGSRLQELLAQGLDEEEERLLEALSEVSSDSSFRGSDEEAIDLIDSDFSEEEIEGTLEGEVVETDASVRREERKEKQEDRKRRIMRSQKFSAASRARQGLSKRRRRDGQKSGGSQREGDEDGDEDGDAFDYRAVGRLRPAPTIPLERRLAEAEERARTLRDEAAAEEGSEGDGEGGDKTTGANHSHVSRTSPASHTTLRSFNQATMAVPSQKRRRTRSAGTRGASYALMSTMNERVLQEGRVPDTWWRVENNEPLTYAVLAEHCAAHQGWLCSPTLDPLYLAAAQDRVAFAYTSPRGPELFAVDAEGVLTPVTERVATHRPGRASSPRHATSTTKAGKNQRGTRAPVIAYVLAPPRSSWQPKGYRSGQSTLAPPHTAPSIVSFAALPTILQSSTSGIR